MQKIKKFLSSPLVGDISMLLAGGVLFGVSMNLFFLPGAVVLGGVTGIATTLNILFGLPVGVMIMAINIPLLIISGIVFGWRFIVRTILGIAVTSVATDLLTFLPVSSSDPLLCALLGGITMGTGCGLMFSHAFTTGGTDIIAWLLRRRFKGMPTGRLILFVDFFVIIGAALVMKNYVGVFYSVIALFAFTLTIDYVMGGADRAKLVFIFSHKSEEVADGIFNEVGRGVTMLYGRGWYTRQDREIIMCAVKRTEAHAMAALVSRLDPEAFTIFADVSQVVGDGFKSPG